MDSAIAFNADEIGLLVEDYLFPLCLSILRAVFEERVASVLYEIGKDHMTLLWRLLDEILNKLEFVGDDRSMPLLGDADTVRSLSRALHEEVAARFFALFEHIPSLYLRRQAHILHYDGFEVRHIRSLFQFHILN